MNLLRTIWNGLARLWALVYWRATGVAQRRAAYDTIEINLRGSLPERWAPGSPLELRRSVAMTHRGLVELLDHVAADRKIQRVILTIGPLAAGMARVQEIGRALDRVAASGKDMVAVCENIGNREFLLAARCPRRFLAPAAVLALTGVHLEVTYLRGLLDKAAVEPDLLVAGKFKNAGETFTRTSPSDAAREMTEGLVDGIYEQLVADLAATLGKTPTQVRKLIDGGPYTPARAVKAGLIEKAAYRDEVLAELGIKKESTILNGARYLRFARRRDKARARSIAAPIVALVHLSGTIQDGRGDPARGRPGARGYCRLLQQLRRNKQVKAVVLRVSSPGGAATGSDLIRREAQRLAKKKPLIVSMGDVAASGGYMVAVDAQTILAERGTLTGSIGVIGGKADVSGLLAKVGISTVIFQRGKAAGVFSTTRRFNVLERRRMEEVIGAMYEAFKEVVAAGRKLTRAEVDELAEGRVWTGAEAAASRLVDEIGGLGEALQRARAEAGGAPGEPVRLVELPSVPSPLRMLMSWGSAQTRLPGALAEYERVRMMTSAPFAGLPFDLRIK